MKIIQFNFQIVAKEIKKFALFSLSLELGSLFHLCCGIDFKNSNR